MKFDKVTHKVDIDTLNKEEAQDYMLFLDIERKRHKYDIVDAAFWIDMYKDNRTLTQLFISARLRHKEDIESIDCLIKQVKEGFEL